VMGQSEFVAARAKGELVVAATRNGVLVSKDAGASWNQARLASYSPNVKGVTISPDGGIFVATREGAVHSADSGASWEHMLNGLPDKDITSIAYDGSKKRLLATSSATGVIFESTDGGRSWQRGPDAGYPLRRVSVVRGRFFGATPFDGVVMQPGNETQSVAAGGSGSGN
jgi:photosystem II stability/assembly factor-like uncharacterized protein